MEMSFRADADFWTATDDLAVSTSIPSVDSGL